MNDYLDIFEETTCPSMEVLDHYLANGLDPGDQQKIEAHLLDCPLCVDAIEGLSMVEDRKGLRYRIKRIKELSQQRIFTVTEKRREALSKRKSRVKPMKIVEILVAAAASIAILLATVFVIFQSRPRSSENMAMQQAPSNRSMEAIVPVPIDSNTTEQLAEVLILADSNESEVDASTNSLYAESISPKSQKPIESKLRNNKKSKRPQLVSENQSAPASKEVESIPVVIAAPQVPEPSNAEEKASLDLITDSQDEMSDIMPIDSVFIGEEIAMKTEALLPKERQDISLRVYEEQSAQSSSKMQLKEESEASRRSRIGLGNKSDDDQFNQAYGKQTRYEVLRQLMREGKSYYRQKRYEEAKNRFEEVLQSDERNREAQLYMGKALLVLEDIKGAQKVLKKVKDDYLYGEEASWKLVEVYIKLSKEQSLRKLLSEIIEGNGKYKTGAKQILKGLDEN